MDASRAIHGFRVTIASSSRVVISLIFFTEAGRNRVSSVSINGFTSPSELLISCNELEY